VVPGDSTVPELVFSLGSNVDAHRHIRLAVARLRAEFGALQCSSVYQSSAVGFQGEDFLNLVTLASSNLSLDAILKTVKKIEEEFGRERGVPRFSPRTIDIDVLLFGIQDGKDCAIDLPRDEITKHAFVLQPLAELLPDNVHPQTGSSYSAMWEEFDDPSQELAVIEFDWSGIGEN
jgi:2-amino-4-hydroxy-6-hydroxymethyldihydropteridine diphosphokinase